jgi:hypothetical protein
VAGYFPGNLLVFAAVVFVLGPLCGAFRMEKTAYRYAGVTLAIIVLIPRSNVAWIVALHRFFRSLDWNLSRFGGRGRLAGASTRIRKTKR